MCRYKGCNKSRDIYIFNEGYSNGKRKLYWWMYLTQIDSLPDLVCIFSATTTASTCSRSPRRGFGSTKVLPKVIELLSLFMHIFVVVVVDTPLCLSPNRICSHQETLRAGRMSEENCRCHCLFLTTMHKWVLSFPSFPVPVLVSSRFRAICWHHFRAAKQCMFFL